MTASREERAEGLYRELLGSCRELPDDVLDDRGLCDMIDGLMRRCEGCGWWVEVDDVDEAGYCDDCRGDET